MTGDATAAGRVDPRGPVSLTGRASLNALGSLLDYAAKALVSLVITPILVSGLGRTLYGLWEMLSRLGTYMSVADGRPTEALRLVIAQHQAVPDDLAKRRFVGSALVVWVLTLPIVVTLGTVLTWFSPSITGAPPEHHAAVRLTCGLVVASFVFTSLASVPESVLRGANLGYRRMGLQASLNILGGLVAAGGVWAGLGLTALGHSQIIRAVATGLCFWVLVRKSVPWFGAARPSVADVKGLLGMSIWLTAGDAIAKIMLASDVLVLGAVLAPALVTTYALTGYAARTAIGIHVFAAGAAIPGLGSLLGNGQLERAAYARRQLQTLTWLFTSVVGATILMRNRSFLALWVGQGNYAGIWVDLLIVLTATQTAFIRTDAYVIDATLRPKLRVMLGGVAAVLSIALSILMTRSFGIVGLCAGLLVGRAVQSVAYPLMVRASLGSTQRGAAASPAWRARRGNRGAVRRSRRARTTAPGLQLVHLGHWRAADHVAGRGPGTRDRAAGRRAASADQPAAGNVSGAPGMSLALRSTTAATPAFDLRSVLVQAIDVNPIVRGALYLFVLSIPFDAQAYHPDRDPDIDRPDPPAHHGAQSQRLLPQSPAGGGVLRSAPVDSRGGHGAE